MLPRSIGARSFSILFIEPIKQGYGDLFFQTSLFERLSKQGYKIYVLTNKNHSQILENNPHISGIWMWNILTWYKTMRSEMTIIGLGRDTIRETLFIISSFKSKKIILDLNIDLWKTVFGDNSSTLAWHKLCDYYLGSYSDVPIPQIYFSTIEQNFIEIKKTENKIGIIYGVEKIEKRYDQMPKLVEEVANHSSVILLGKGQEPDKTKNNILNLVNKLSFRQTLVELATCKSVIGTEGSLLQIAATLVPQVIVLDQNNRFASNSHPNLVKKAIIVDTDKAEVERIILQEIKSFS